MEKKRLSKEVRLSVLAFVLFVTGLIVVIPSAQISAGKGGRKEYLLKQYYPLSEGKTWNYLQTYADGHKNYEVYCIGGTEKIDGKAADKLWDFDSGNFEEGEPDYRYDCMAWTKDGLQEYMEVCSDGSHATYDPPMIRLPHMIRVGTTFKHTSTRTEYDADGNKVGSWPCSIEITLEGEEDIEVLAGSFRCLRFSWVDKEGDEEGDKETHWLSPRIGEVKEIGPEADRELISFTEHNTTYHPGD